MSPLLSTFGKSILVRVCAKTMKFEGGTHQLQEIIFTYIHIYNAFCICTQQITSTVTDYTHVEIQIHFIQFQPYSLSFKFH